MFCDEALDAVEAIAAGDLTADGRVAAHLASCPNCALALESARQLERSLRLRAVPAPPAQFTSRTITRVRRAQWRSDQFLDAGFNLAIIAIVVGGLGISASGTADAFVRLPPTVTFALAPYGADLEKLAERARASLAKALCACTGAVELGLAAEPGLLTARIRAAPEQLAAMGRVLAELSPERVDDRLELRFVRPQLDVV